jgi:adenylate cyclase
VTDTEDAERDLEQTLLGGGRKYTRLDVAELAGVDAARAERLWLAMGFPTVSDTERVFTDGDVDALRILDSLTGAGFVEPDLELAQARAMGQSLSRLAEWQARDVIGRVRSLSTDPAVAESVAAELLPAVERLQNYVWRRHLAAAAGRALSTDTEELARQPLTVGFADIVGYTNVTRHARIDELSSLLERFEENATEAIVGERGQIVKTVGDEVLFSVPEPADAGEIALRLTDPARPAQGLPKLRVGMAMGTVLSRFGDIYGPVVNLAARLTSAARPGNALVDRELATALGDDARFELRKRRPIAVRGYSHLRSWSLRRA